MWQASEGLIAILGAIFALGALKALSGQVRQIRHHHARNAELESIPSRANTGVEKDNPAFSQATYGSQHKATPADKRPTVEDMAAKGI